MLDDLVERGLGTRFVLAGLCSGAYYAFLTGVEDERVAGVVMLNARILRWDPALELQLRQRRMGERLSLARARDLLLGRVSRAAGSPSGPAAGCR